jgi:DNA modification methylase
MPPSVNSAAVSGPAPKVAHQVQCGDAFALAGELVTESVDLLLTSPPYWGARTYGQQHDEGLLERWLADGDGTAPPWDWYRRHGGVLGLEPLPEWYVEHLVELVEACRHSLKATASVWIVLGDSYFARWSSVRDEGRRGLAGTDRTRRRVPSGGWRHDKQLLLLPARFAIAMQQRGWVLRNDVIWSKPNATPQPARDRLALSHEHLLHLVQRTQGRRPQYFYDRAQAEPHGRDVVHLPTGSPRDGYTAAFPDRLIAPRIASSSPPGGVVLDPCCGAGTTLAVAAAMGRTAIGFDIDPGRAAAAAAGLALTPRGGNQAA